MERSEVESLANACRERVVLRDVQVGLNVYLQCFDGETVLSCVRDVLTERGEGADLGLLACCEMLKLGIMVSAEHDNTFQATGLFRFAKDVGHALPTAPRGTAEQGKALFLRSFTSSEGTGEVVMMVPWTGHEDALLMEAVAKHGENWEFVSYQLTGRTAAECESRWVQKLADAELSTAKKSKFSIKRRAKKPSTETSSGGVNSPAMEYIRRKEAFKAANDDSMVGETYKARSSSFDESITDMRGLHLSASSSMDVHSHSSRLDISDAKRKSTPLTLGGAPRRQEQSMNSLPEAAVNINLLCMRLIHPCPSGRMSLRESHYYVKVVYDEGRKEAMTRPVVEQPNSGVSWNQVLQLESVRLDTLLEFRVYIKHRFVPDEEVGRTEISVGDLAKRPSRSLVLSDTHARVVTSADAADLTLLQVAFNKDERPSGWPYPVSSLYSTEGAKHKYAKHLMVFTRGTRGDVQPFIALARGLANKYNWMITICTELRYRSYVKSYAENLDQGAIRFRISGGDTQKRVDSKVSKWAMNLKSGAMQHIMLAFSEAEFFESEPAFYYWAKSMKPDYIMFGFTVASIAMIVSEALKIPLLGFILQPTCIPSKQYAPVVPLDEAAYKKMLESGMTTKHEAFSTLKVIAENTPVTGHLNLNKMRVRRNLDAIQRRTGKHSLRTMFQSTTWTNLQDRGVPLIVPINEIAFGGRPDDWGEKTVLTNYIFLRGSSVPPLSAGQEAFIHAAKSTGKKLICLAFSSMPVERLDILRIAIRIIEECKEKVCVFALIGDHTDDPGYNQDVEDKAQAYTKQNRLFVDKGAPFGRLFPQLDAIVAHGGLGTTGEAIMAGVPVIITGVLLFDQRFWGSRVSDMGLGSFPIHISKFYKRCVELIDKALDPSYAWRENAQKMGKQILDSMADDPSGVDINVDTVVEMAKQAPFFSYVRRKGTLQFFGSSTSSGHSDGSPLHRLVNHFSGGEKKSSSDAKNQNQHRRSVSLPAHVIAQQQQQRDQQQTKSP